jgi:hypothetical protein
MHFVIVSGNNNGLANFSRDSDSLEIESWHKFPGDYCKDVFLHLLFNMSSDIKTRFLQMEPSIRVPNALLLDMMPKVREFGLSLIDDYMADKKVVNGDKIVVLGYVISVETYKIAGKGSELKYFHRLLKFLEQAITQDEPVYIYFYPRFDELMHKVLVCLKQQSSPVSVHELAKCTELSENEVRQSVAFLEKTKIIVSESDTEKFRFTHRGKFSIL